MSSARVLPFLFGFAPPVSRRTYAMAGFSLAALKYVVDALIIFVGTSQFFNPLLYVHPLLSARVPNTSPQPVLMLMVAWAVPFLWIGMVLTLRRTVDAGLSPWLSLFYFVPVVNLFLMIALCFVPTRPAPTTSERAKPRGGGGVLQAAFLGAASATLIGATMTALCVYVLGDYGGALFFGTPVLIGAINAYVVNRRAPQSLLSTLAIVTLSMVLLGGAMLVVAFEGLICVVMAIPIAIVGALLGAVVGRFIASNGGPRAGSLSAVLVALPLLAGFESSIADHARWEIVSSIEVDAPPDQVWPFVVQFGDLPPPTEAIFRSGVAYPVRARIEGSGVGAIRYCQFSTGDFVEPITVWDPPARLSFDVRDQPLPMRELSPYPDIHPPHLDGYFRSVAGEFRLTPLPGGRTLLAGSTWYELDMAPSAYWRIWAESLVHAIHGRVLEHIKRLAEPSALHRNSQR